MPWNNPHDFVDGEVWLEEYGDQLRENQLYLYALAWQKRARQVPTAAWSTASNSPVTWNPAAPLEATFTKRSAETALQFDIEFSGYITGGSTSLIQIAVNVGGADYQSFDPHYWNAANDYQEKVDDILVSGLAAGVYTAQLRVLVVPGGFTFNVDGNGFARMKVREVYEAG